MPKPKQLVISNFKTVADSPHVGLEMIKNCDLSSRPGAVLVSSLPEEQSSATIGNVLIHWIRQDPTTGNFFALASTGKVFKRVWGTTTWTDISDANNTNAATGNGLVIWKDYVLAIKDTTIDAYKISTSTWVNTNWAPDGLALTGDDWHPALVGQDDIVYIGTGRYIYTIREESGSNFDPTSDSTFIATQKALDLPEDYRVRCLTELNKNLMIGTWVSDKLEIGDIFPWDRLQQSFNLPIKTKELGIRSMLEHGGIVYFFAGLHGQLYATDGSRVTKLRKIPRNILGIAGGQWVDVYPDAMSWHKNKLFFGTSFNNTIADDGYGVWSYDAGKLVLEYEASEGITGSTGAMYIGSVNAFTEDQVVFSWQNATGSADSGIDNVSNSKRFGSYKAHIDSKFYDVAFKHEKRTFRTLEVRLARDLVANQGVRIKYRESLNDSWTTLATFTDTKSSHNQQIFLTLQSIQLRIELTTDGTGMSGTNSSPEFLSVILH